MKFTENALNQFKKLIDESENPKSGIRFYTVQGCCSPSLQMGIEESPAPDDSVIQMSGVDIFVTADDRKINNWHKNILKFGTITNTLNRACEVNGEMIKKEEI